MTDARLLHNPLLSETLNGESLSRAPLEFHSRLPNYHPTPLTEVPMLADTLGLSRVWVKDESHRLGLPAFKILGASWAVYRALEEHVGGKLGSWDTLEGLKEQLVPSLPLALTTATGGNHGRAVAHMARLLGIEARIFVPNDMAKTRMEAIESEGAAVIVVDGSYDDAVARSAEEAGDRCLLISDTSWPGYEDVSRWVIEGYSTIMWEIDDELARRGEQGPNLVVAQIGVGAFAAAVVRHYCRSEVSPHPKLTGVEPMSAACMLSSVEAGHIVHVPGPHPSIMVGLNCGTPSLIAWPIVSKGIDLFVSIEDERACQAMRLLAEAGLVAGETGAAGLGGLLELLCGEGKERTRSLLNLDGESRVLLFNCEGATDPAAYARIVESEGYGISCRLLRL